MPEWQHMRKDYRHKQRSRQELRGCSWLKTSDKEGTHSSPSREPTISENENNAFEFVLGMFLDPGCYKGEAGENDCINNRRNIHISREPSFNDPEWREMWLFKEFFSSEIY